MSLESVALQLIAIVYEAATDPARWPEFLQAYAAAVEGTLTCLSLHDSSGLGVTAAVGLENSFKDQYMAYYGARNEHVRHGSRLFRPGTVLLGNEMVPERQYLQSEYYNDFLRHMNVAHIISGIAEVNGSTLSARIRGIRTRARFAAPTACGSSHSHGTYTGSWPPPG